jgi:hypothetical protein
MSTRESFAFEGVDYTLTAERVGRKWLGQYTDEATGKTELVGTPCSSPAKALKMARVGATMTHGFRHPQKRAD